MNQYRQQNKQTIEDYKKEFVDTFIKTGELLKMPPFKGESLSKIKKMRQELVKMVMVDHLLPISLRDMAAILNCTKETIRKDLLHLNSPYDQLKANRTKKQRNKKTDSQIAQMIIENRHLSNTELLLYLKKHRIEFTPYQLDKFIRETSIPRRTGATSKFEMLEPKIAKRLIETSNRADKETFRTLKQIAEEFGVSLRIVSQTIEKYGLQRRQVVKEASKLPQERNQAIEELLLEKEVAIHEQEKPLVDYIRRHSQEDGDYLSLLTLTKKMKISMYYLTNLIEKYDIPRKTKEPFQE